jgi:mono/diheme cytochrome c family protein
MVRIRAVAFCCGAVALSAMSALTPLVGQETANDEESKFDYTVIDGRVDESTMRGFMIYTGTCMACHGPDGLGSAFAPSLVRAAERRTFEDFARSIIQGIEIQPGQVMPSFADDMRVMSHVGDIWNYLGARAEGGLGRGRPQLIEYDDQGED